MAQRLLDRVKMQVAPDGTLVFQYDAAHDVVVARARWTLEVPTDVVSWHERYISFFRGRFSSPKDLVMLNEEFDISTKVSMIWGLYRAKLFEQMIRYSVGVKSNPRVRLSTNTSGTRYGVSTLEASDQADAVRVIQGLRDRDLTERTKSEGRKSSTDLLKRPDPGDRSGGKR